MIRPSIVEKYFPENIYYEPTMIKTSTGEKPIQFRADIPAFPEFNSSNTITFLLFDFHEYFDGILGLGDLVNMQLSIDLQNQRLVSNIVEIPFQYRQKEDKSFTFSVNAHEISLQKLPVNYFKGDVIFNESYLDDLYIPPTLTKAELGFATVEIHNTATIE